MFLWIGPLFRRIGPRVSQDRTFSKTNAPIPKKHPVFQNAIEGKLRVQDRASERMQDQIIEEIKELESTKTEEALHIAGKEHDLWMYQNEREKQQGCRESIGHHQEI